MLQKIFSESLSLLNLYIYIYYIIIQISFKLRFYPIGILQAFYTIFIIYFAYYVYKLEFFIYLKKIHYYVDIVGILLFYIKNIPYFSTSITSILKIFYFFLQNSSHYPYIYFLKSFFFRMFLIYICIFC